MISKRRPLQGERMAAQPAKGCRISPMSPRRTISASASSGVASPFKMTGRRRAHAPARERKPPDRRRGTSRWRGKDRSGWSSRRRARGRLGHGLTKRDRRRFDEAAAIAACRDRLRLYRRLFLERLQTAFDAGDLKFCGDLAPLRAPTAFAKHLAQLRRVSRVVYAKRPFGRAAVLRYTHRVAIANGRLLDCERGASASAGKTIARAASRRR